MSHALTTFEHGMLPSTRDWETMLSMSEVLVKSGMLPAQIKTAASAVAIIQKGIELGIQPMYALSNIVNIQGKPTANAELMLALIYRDHGDGAVTFTETSNTACEIAYARRSWKQPRFYTFTIEDAKQAGLLSNQTWQKYPAAMLRARCASAVARMAFPDSIGGLYTAEELGAEVDEDGTPIQATIEPRPIRETSPPIVTERHAPLSAPRIKGKRGDLTPYDGIPREYDEQDDMPEQITRGTLQRLQITAKENGWQPDDMHELIATKYTNALDPATGKASSRFLTEDEGRELIAYITPPETPEQAVIAEVREQAAVKGLDER